MGKFSVSPAFAQWWGYPLVAPDGSKVLLGNGIVVSIQGTDIGDIAAAGLTGTVWSDNSDHVCGVSASGDALVETNLTRATQVVSQAGTALLDVPGCGPEAERAVVVEGNTSTGSPSAVAVIDLSTGQVLATHPGATGIVTAVFTRSEPMVGLSYCRDEGVGLVVVVAAVEGGPRPRPRRRAAGASSGRALGRELATRAGLRWPA